MEGELQKTKTDLQPGKKQRNRWHFFTSLFIIIIVFTLCVSMVFAFFSFWIKPAAIPQIVIAEEKNTNQEDTKPDSNQDKEKKKEEGAFHIPEGDMEDALIGDGLQAPEGFTSEDRKELFYTFLVIGIDTGANTDTIIVASYDGLKQEANLISIPRDSLVNVKRPMKKINAAYPVGTQNGGIEGGIAQLQREIKTIIGFIPDFYLLVNFEAFTRLVDAVGGIEIDVPFGMYYDDPYQNLHINIPKGLQYLNGEDALRFARYRKGNNINSSISDYDRINNQQTVIQAVTEQLLKPRNLLKIPEFIDIFTDNVFSNLEARDILWFAGEANKIRGTGALSMHTMPTTGTSGEPMYYEYLDSYGVLTLINETINPFIKDIEAKDLSIVTSY